MPPKKLNQKDPSQTDAQPSTTELKDIASHSSTPDAKLKEAATQAETALAQYKTASSLRSLADTVRDPAKRTKYLQDAYDAEIAAHGKSKKARILSSGAFQGSVGGGGIGMAVGAGLGTVVGTLVGTVATIPTTAVGTLVGAGVGGVRGPWVKLGGGDGKDKKDGEGKEEEQGHEDAGEGEEDGDGADEGVPDPRALREAADKIAAAREEAAARGNEEKKEKKKPRKLEVRGKQAAAASG